MSAASGGAAAAIINARRREEEAQAHKKMCETNPDDSCISSSVYVTPSVIQAQHDHDQGVFVFIIFLGIAAALVAGMLLNQLLSKPKRSNPDILDIS